MTFFPSNIHPPGLADKNKTSRIENASSADRISASTARMRIWQIRISARVMLATIAYEKIQRDTKYPVQQQHDPDRPAAKRDEPPGHSRDDRSINFTRRLSNVSEARRQRLDQYCAGRADASAQAKEHKAAKEDFPSEIESKIKECICGKSRNRSSGAMIKWIFSSENAQAGRQVGSEN